MRLPGNSSLVTWNKWPTVSQTWWRVSCLFWTELSQKDRTLCQLAPGQGETAAGRGGILQTEGVSTCCSGNQMAKGDPQCSAGWQRRCPLHPVLLWGQCWDGMLHSTLLSPAAGWAASACLPPQQRMLVAKSAVETVARHQVSTCILLC